MYTIIYKRIFSRRSSFFLFFQASFFFFRNVHLLGVLWLAEEGAFDLGSQTLWCTVFSTPAPRRLVSRTTISLGQTPPELKTNPFRPTIASSWVFRTPEGGNIYLLGALFVLPKENCPGRKA